MTTIITKNSSTAGAAPTAGDLVQGELAVNVTDKALYTENASGTVVKLNTPSIVDNGNATAITIDSSENVGVGVTPSAWSGVKAIQLNSNLGVYGAGTAEFGAVSNTYYNGTNWIYGASAVAARYAISAGQHQWFNAGSGTAGNAITFTQAMTLDASGNLLVGATSGGSGKLRVSGGSDAFNSPYAAPSAGYFFSSNSADANCVEIYQGRFNKAALVISGNNTGTITAVQFYDQGSSVGTITTTSSATAYNTSSDYRLKNSIAPMTGALSKVTALKPVTYKWNVDGSDGEGFIAHELAEVCPQAVVGEKDAVNEDGTPKYQGIDTSFLVATLTAAIQELKAELDSNKREFDAYKATHP